MHPPQDLYINESYHIPVQLLEMRAVRSSGPGGQHVNKVSTKVELHYHIHDAFHLPIKFDVDGNILITSQKYRSQKENADDTLLKLKAIILRAIIPPKIRRTTKPTFAGREERIANKKKRGMIKQQRQLGKAIPHEE